MTERQNNANLWGSRAFTGANADRPTANRLGSHPGNSRLPNHPGNNLTDRPPASEEPTRNEAAERLRHLLAELGRNGTVFVFESEPEMVTLFDEALRYEYLRGRAVAGAESLLDSLPADEGATHD